MIPYLMSDESVVHDERRLNGSPPSFMLSAVRDLNPGSLVDLVKPILTVQDDERSSVYPHDSPF